MAFSEAAAVGLAVIAVVIVRYRLWNVNFQRPFAYSGGDLIQTEGLVKNVIETGWFQTQPRLGAPFGEVYYDFPLGGESAQFAILRILSLFTHSTGLIVNIYYVAGFGVLAGTTFLVTRRLGFTRASSALVGVVFSLMPYHFFHSQAHLIRSTYISVPLAVLLVVRTAQWRNEYLRPADSDCFVLRDRLMKRPLVWTLILAIIVGVWDTVIMAFAVLLVILIGILLAIRDRDWRTAVVGTGTGAAIGVAFVVSNVGTFWYQHIHGPNEAAGKRFVGESELYGLKINRMILPSDGSRVAVLARLWNTASAHVVSPSEAGQSLGLLGTAGLIGLILWVLIGRRTSGHEVDTAGRSRLAEIFALTSMVGLLFATVAGFSTIAGLVGLASVRTWGRMAIVIGLLALLQVAIWFDQAANRLASARRLGLSRRWAGGICWASAALLVLVNMWVGPPVRSVDRSVVSAQFASDRSFDQAIANILPAGSSVMQLPTSPFPEAYPPGDMDFYEPLRAYIADEGDLKWSYGAVKGRDTADWQQTISGPTGTVNALPAIVGMGFTGLWVDLAGYSDEPNTPVLLARKLKTEPIKSRDGRLEFFDLRPFRRGLAQSDAQLRELAAKRFGVRPPS